MGKGVLVASPLTAEVRIAGLNGFDLRNDLVLDCVRFGMHGLHESSYFYFKVYAGTRNLKQTQKTQSMIHMMYTYYLV